MVRLQRGESPRAWVETLSPEQRRLETLFTSLRTSSGLNLQAFEEKFGENLLRTKRSWIERWEREGLARIEDQRLVLTFSGKMLADEIVAKLGY